VIKTVAQQIPGQALNEVMNVRRVGRRKCEEVPEVGEIKPRVGKIAGWVEYPIIVDQQQQEWQRQQ
jgi:hypothetical protein